MASTTLKIIGFHTGTDSYLLEGESISTIKYPDAADRDAATIALGINDADHIVGRVLDWTSYGFIKVGETYTSFVLPGAFFIEPTGINNGGQIVGTFNGAEGSGSFLLEGGAFYFIEEPSALGTYVHGIDRPQLHAGERHQRSETGCWVLHRCTRHARVSRNSGFGA